LILGCTHYPLIKKQINQYYNGKVTVLDTSEIVAKSLYDYLESSHLLNEMNAHIRHFYVSDYTQSFETSTKIFLENRLDFNTTLFGNRDMFSIQITKNPVSNETGFFVI
jgi:glutamate racemase